MAAVIACTGGREVVRWIGIGRSRGLLLKILTDRQEPPGDGRIGHVAGDAARHLRQIPEILFARHLKISPSPGDGIVRGEMRRSATQRHTRDLVPRSVAAFSCRAPQGPDINVGPTSPFPAVIGYSRLAAPSRRC